MAVTVLIPLCPMCYDFFIRLYAALVALFSRLNTKAKLRHVGNLNYRQCLANRHYKQKLIWFHCASLGEFEQGRPLLEAFRRGYPDWQILLTFFSPSGYEVRKNYSQADFICYLPFDLKSEAGRFFDAFKPDLVVFVKYEFWRNYIFEASKRKVLLISVSGIFRANQLFFKPWGGFQRATLRAISYFFVQNENSLLLLRQLGIEQARVAGDTRFDRVLANAEGGRQITEAGQFKSNAELLVCGSVWPEDMQVLIPFMRLRRNVKCIVAPHEIRPGQIESWRRQIDRKSICFSEITAETDLAAVEILFIDNVGMLASLYQYADYAFIGGAFGSGLHNILEAAVFGVPVLFGNKRYDKFEEANELIEKGVAFAISNADELTRIFDGLGTNQRDEIARNAKNYIAQKAGATAIILEWMTEQISKMKE